MNYKNHIPLAYVLIAEGRIGWKKGISSIGRATVLHTVGQVFEPPIP